jgi:hypothetical protein
LPRFAGGCGGCHKALGRSHARCSVAHSELCGQAGGPSSADDGPGLSLRACFCQGQIKRRCPILLDRYFELRMSNDLWPLGSLGSKSLSSGAKFRPEGGRIRIRGTSRSWSGTRGLVGFARVTLNGGQSQTVHVSFPVTEAVAFAQLVERVERVERPVTVLVDEAVERGAHARATPSRGMLPMGTQASRDRCIGLIRAAPSLGSAMGRRVRLDV